MSVFDQTPSQRHQLAQALRELREQAGLSGMELSRRSGISQASVSRIENAKQVPSAVDLGAWMEATGAGAARQTELVELRERVATEAVAWRRHQGRSLKAIQAEVQAAEAAASRVRLFHPTLVPGLLQTPAYIRAIAEAFWLGSRDDLAGLVAGRVARQTVLYETGKRLEFVIGEAALRWWPGPAEMMAGQLDRIGVIAGLENVTIGILPLDREVPVWHSHGFTMFEQADSTLVHLELLGAGQNVRDPDQVTRYVTAFERLQKAAVVDQEALALLERLTAQLRNP